MLLLVASTLCAAQVTKDPQQIELGRAMFRNACAPCHGIGAQGGRGPDLTRGTYNNGDSDADLFRVISHGVPGTEMPAARPDLIDSAGIWLVISFIRSVTQAEVGPAPGDRAAGEKLFWEKGGCGQCHAVGGRGGSLGPNLTRVGRERSLAYLRESIVSPDADISPGYETVTVETRDGRKIVGVAKRLDNFSIELMDLSGKVYSFQRSALVSVNRESRSADAGLRPHVFRYRNERSAGLSQQPARERGPVPPRRLPTRGLNEKRLLTAQDDPATWLMYGRNYAGWRYSPLKQINAANVAQLRPQWIYQTSAPGGFETTPLVYDGTMWLTGPSNHAYALDLRTGREIWKYHSNVPEGINLCCGEPNRGFAALGGLSFKVNLEGDLVAFDSQSGQVIWKTQLADYHKGYSATGAPLVVKNLVVVGIAGAENGQRGFIDAYEAQTGKRAWRFYVVPAAGEPGSETWAGDSWKNGGGHPWTTGTYDPDPEPCVLGDGKSWTGRERRCARRRQPVHVQPGGAGCRHRQAQVVLPVHSRTIRMTGMPSATRCWWTSLYQGRPVKAVIQADRNGFFYALDRTNGKVLVAKPYTKVTWATGIGPDGRPIRVPGQEPSEDGTRTCPGLGGGHNWQPTAYSPRDRSLLLQFYRPTVSCTTNSNNPTSKARCTKPARMLRSPGNRGPAGYWRSIPPTGEIKWRFELVHGENGRTPGHGRRPRVHGRPRRVTCSRWMLAPARCCGTSGRAGGLLTAPITYTLDGKQVVAVASGSDILTFTLPQPHW